MSVRITDNSANVSQNVSTTVSTALRTMGQDIYRTAQPSTPYKLGNLRKDVTIKTSGTTTKITWEQPYSAVQEAGQRRGAKPFSKYTTAGTGKGFAEKSVEKVVGNAETYFKRFAR